MNRIEYIGFVILVVASSALGLSTVVGIWILLS